MSGNAGMYKVWGQISRELMASAEVPPFRVFSRL